jgi:hypothetical protein
MPAQDHQSFRPDRWKELSDGEQKEAGFAGRARHGMIAVHEKIYP